jgi:hypothetical protein
MPQEKRIGRNQCGNRSSLKFQFLLHAADEYADSFHAFILLVRSACVPMRAACSNPKDMDNKQPYVN